jgi:WD40 repeat protein
MIPTSLAGEENNMAHDVFISYSNRDKPIADGICANLEAAGVRCWIAPRDIAPGEAWPAAISTAISHSRVMVLVFSSYSNNSDDVSRELILAATNKLIIIPFKIEDVVPQPGMQYYLAQTHWLDAMNPPTREQIHILVETVKKNLLAPEIPAAPPVTPSTGEKAAQPLRTKKLKPWMLLTGVSLLVLVIIALCAGGLALRNKLQAAIPDSKTPTRVTTRLAQAPVQTATTPLQMPARTATASANMTAPGSTKTSVPSPTTALSINVHASPGTILEVTGNFVAYSPDGKWLIIGERQIHFYDPQSLTEKRFIQADRWVNGLAISPDSKVLAAIDESRGVMLFDMATGSELRTLDGTTISTSAASSSFLAFTPDSLTLAVVIGDTVKLYSVASGQETSTIVAKGARSIVFSPDGQTLYTCGWESVAAWEVASGAQIRTFGASYVGANRLALSPDGSLLVTAGVFDEPMVLWDAATGRQLRTFAGHKDGVNSLVFSPDGKLLASAAGDVTIKLWDVATGNVLQTLTGHSEAAASLAFSPDGSTLVSGSQDGTTRLWTISAGEPQPTEAPTASSASVRPTALPLSANAVGVGNAAQVKNLKKLDVESEFVAYSPDGKWLLIGGRQIHYYDAQSLTEVRNFQADRWVNGLSISPDSKVLAAIDESRGVMLFDLATGSELRTLERTTISTSAASSLFLAFTPDSLTLAVVIGNTVKLYSVASGQETGTIVAKDANAILFSPDGQTLYAGGWMGITAWDVASGALIRTFGDMSYGTNCLALSPDGSLLVSGGMFDQPLVMWDTASGHQVRTFAGHKDGVTSLVFSPDGKLLASTAGDVTIKLWDVATGNVLQTLVGHSEAATSLAFSPDGSALASTAYNQGVWLWGVPAN